MRKIALILIFYGLALGVYGKEKTFSIKDVLNYQTLSQFSISPDGRRILWVQKKADLKQNKYISHIWMLNLDEEKPIQLTRGKNSEYSPKISPDGKRIAFLSSRDGKPQVYILDLRGGEPKKVTSMEKGVMDFEWLGNTKLVVLAREKQSLRERVRKREKDDSIIVEDRKFFFPTRLFILDLKTEKIKRFTHNNNRISSFSISPGGKYIITSHITTPSYVAEPEPRPIYFLWEVKTGKSKEIFKDRYFSPHNFVWMSDDTVFFLEQYSRHEDKRGPGIEQLYVYYPKNNVYQKIPIQWKNGIGGLYYGSLTCGGKYVLTALANGVRNIPLVIEVNGKSPSSWKYRRIKDKFFYTIMGMKLSRDGKKLLFLRSTSTEPPQLYISSIKDGNIQTPKQLTHVNSFLKKRFIAKVEVIKWKSKGGRIIEGLLYYPKNYKKGKKYPLILNIHGGPAGYDADWFKNSWAYYPHYWASRGAFVLFVNYSGSSNYGLDFVESIIGHYYELEVPDILSGVDYLIRKGMVDPNKLGVAGWSNGAILTIALITKTNRFKVAAPGAGDVNWTSDYGNCMFGPQFDELYFGGTPWDNTKTYIEKSPIFKARRITTPTIIFFGTKDRNVPTEQGWQLFRALKRIGKAPVRFILFPGEPHGLRKPSHQRKKMQEEIAWFNKYLFGNEKEERPFEEKSNLARLMEIRKASMVNGLYGIIKNSILVPETVKVEGIEVSKFEITRAQFKEFLKENKSFSHHWPEETGNFPANGISYEEAKKYCQWLSEKTGDNYRLPTEEEFKKLETVFRSTGNVLDWWAGYSPNPDEARELRKYIGKHLGFSSLILPVGSFYGTNGIYDIKGNLAEWIEGGKVMGLSCWHTSDKSEEYKTPPSEVIGFRIIREVKK